MKDLLTGLLGAPEGVVLYQLLFATQFTIYLSAIAFAGGGTVGALVTLLRIAPARSARSLATAYIWFFQSAPLLMLLFLFGLGVPRLLGVNVNVWLAASAALTLYTSAYLAEVWRSAVQSIPTGQWEGAEALGLRFWQTLRLVVLPQAVRVSLAPTVGFLVQIIKGTSLAYIIGFSDLMSVGKRWANAPVEGTEPFIIYPLMALIYFALCFPLSRLSLGLEKRLGTVRKTPPIAA
ncbi:amino acid ABC transporter permease [Meridianimarinicoccus roseus]|jgi:polar amino acid transport system permease protein|uniref:Amino acid ABC transporter permease n=1 Tax=Meridianimarinicoccus roseus TaxID=2072018 RepID=A0A2V2LJN9_9RHOB|nr:amino acid ABC transporter permease [Meridianimarinicoccus roseus]PWR04301.1 amino acid ABC transporter permease [Meridianimarinicoccus roseus]